MPHIIHIPNIQPNSLIVMDNASYHSRLDDPVPTKSWTKKMIEWLEQHIYFSNSGLEIRNMVNHTETKSLSPICHR